VKVPLGAPYGHSAFVDQHAALAQAVQALCERPPWCITGVSALLHDEVGLWLELTKPKHWRTRPDGVVEIGLGAIGGGIENDENLLACLERECLEEIGQVATPYSAKDTVIVYEERIVRRVRAAASNAPAPALLTVSANLHGQTWLPECPTLAIVTYWARIKRPPERRDLFGLVRVPWAQIELLLIQTALPWDALQRYADTLLVPLREVPQRAAIRPVWTIRSLQLALQRAAIELGRA